MITEDTIPRASDCIKIDETLFNELFRTHWKGLLGYCCHHTGDIEVSRGLVQEVFCSLWARREQLTITTAAENYLYSAVRLKVAHYTRNKISRKGHLEAFAAKLPRTSEITEKHIRYNELKRIATGFTEQLPARCKQVFQLSRTDGLNVKEIATQMELSERTVENHLSRALKFLRHKLQPFI